MKINGAGKCFILIAFLMLVELFVSTDLYSSSNDFSEVIKHANDKLNVIKYCFITQMLLMFVAGILLNSENRKTSTITYSIGHPITLGNLEVAQNDLPKEINWNVATKECTNLGDGWRLPTKDELNTLYENKDKIGGFARNSYWSSSKCSGDEMWYQSFINGGQASYGKKYKGSVRVVRSC